MLTTKYNAVNNRKEVKMSPESRAEYFRELRKKKKQFVALVDKEKMDAFMKKLSQQGENKTAWLNRKIDEELSK